MISCEFVSFYPRHSLKCVFTWAQLLGEEYNSREKEYEPTKRGRHHHHHHHHNYNHNHNHNHNHHHHHRHVDTNGRSSRSASPEETPRPAVDENLGYDDSLDVAFEHNNKLRDKIQQRMRESENLIATSFGQRNGDGDGDGDGDGGGGGGGGGGDRDVEASEEAFEGYVCDIKAKTNNGLGLLDKALSNLLHNNEKHDHK
jgi:hypothetical protein